MYTSGSGERITLTGTNQRPKGITTFSASESGVEACSGDMQVSGGTCLYSDEGTSSAAGTMASCGALVIAAVAGGAAMLL
jgi:hypothetical protein